MVPAEYGLFHFLEKRFFSSPNDRLGCRTHSASYSVSISRSFPRGKRPVREVNHSHLVLRLRMNEPIGLHVSASAYAFMVCALGYFLLSSFLFFSIQVLPLAHAIFSFTSKGSHCIMRYCDVHIMCYVLCTVKPGQPRNRSWFFGKRITSP